MITTTLRGRNFRFKTKPGLFSKNIVDPGSKLLIEYMVVKSSDTVLDLGCGYGAIGLVAASLANEGKVYMVDTDIRAVKFSKINAFLNKIENVEIIASDGFEELSTMCFDVVLSNPPSHLPKETMIEFIEGAKENLNKGGKLYFVNEKRIQPLVKREFRRVFGNYEWVTQNPQYIVSTAIQNEDW